MGKISIFHLDPPIAPYYKEYGNLKCIVHVRGKSWIGEELFANQTTTSIVEEYDPTKDEWTDKTLMPLPTSHHSSGVIRDKIYIVGGLVATASLAFEYNPITDRWSGKCDMPTARNNFALSAVNEKLYAMGGVPGSLATVEQYDPSSDTWTKKADMPTGRGGLSSTVVGGKIYAIGGARGNVWNEPEGTLGTVEEYTPEGWEYSVSSFDKLVAIWGQIKRGR